MSVIFRFPGTLCLGGFLAISGAAWGQSDAKPNVGQIPIQRIDKEVSNLPTLAPQGGEFPIVASAVGDQVWPSISLSSSGGYITWQDSYIDKKGGGLGNAVLDTTFSASRKTRVNNTIAGNHFRPKVQALGNDNAVIVWEGSVTASGSAASSAPSTPAAPASQSMTAAQQQAVDAAEGYLSDGQGFSEQGLLGQLTSSAGDGFSKSDAEFAINHVNPNWDQQAVDAANGYLSEGQGFSEQGLLQQLTSSAGDGFIQSQAEYAISSLHPDWDAQAVDAAKGYMQMGGFSQASLIQQLTSSAGDGFTQSQAEYAASQVGL